MVVVLRMGIAAQFTYISQQEISGRRHYLYRFKWSKSLPVFKL